MVILVAIMIVSADHGGRRLGRQEGRFESEEFNDRYTVRTDDPKFASDGAGKWAELYTCECT